MKIVKVIIFAFFVALTPIKAFAQCEAPGLAAAAAGSVAARASAHIAAKIPDLTNHYNTNTFARAQTPLLSRLDQMETVLLTRLRKLWGDWLVALKESTAQTVAGGNDQSRNFTSMFDNAGTAATARSLQSAEIEAKKDAAPTEQGCRFDSIATYMPRSEMVSDAVAAGIANDVNTLGNADKNSPAARGEAALNQSRWSFYASTACDPNSNSGFAGCTGAAGPLANATVTPSKTIFGKDTLDMQDAKFQRAVKELIINLTGFEMVPPIASDALETPGGQEQRLENRSYLAQMDAVTALVSSPIGERTSTGVVAPEIEQMRRRAGINNLPNPYKPSAYEIRQAVNQQLWDPAYYISLKQTPNSITQQELYLQAYNINLLSELISKTEKIANVYAIQAANMIKERKPGVPTLEFASRNSASSTVGGP